MVARSCEAPMTAMDWGLKKRSRSLRVGCVIAVTSEKLGIAGKARIIAGVIAPSPDAIIFAPSCSSNRQSHCEHRDKIVRPLAGIQGCLADQRRTPDHPLVSGNV